MIDSVPLCICYAQYTQQQHNSTSNINNPTPTPTKCKRIKRMKKKKKKKVLSKQTLDKDDAYRVDKQQPKKKKTFLISFPGNCEKWKILYKTIRKKLKVCNVHQI